MICCWYLREFYGLEPDPLALSPMWNLSDLR